MKTWLLWITTFLLLEGYALLPGTSFPTLSQTWRDILSRLPPPVDLLFGGATAALLLWLVGPHWIGSAYDRPGLDRLEALSLVVGFLWGVLGARTYRAKRRQPKL